MIGLGSDKNIPQNFQRPQLHLCRVGGGMGLVGGAHRKFREALEDLFYRLVL